MAVFEKVGCCHVGSFFFVVVVLLSFTRTLFPARCTQKEAMLAC
jgi:hypothetical protein